MAAITSEARIERLKAWANTKSTPAKAELLKPGSNIFIGAGIHANAHRAKGATDLTEIEKDGVEDL
jgi:hypothetical protein